MTMVLRARVLGGALLVLLTLALAAVGAGHHVPSPDDAALEAYVLAGGAASDLCDADGTGGVPHRHDCPACHVVASGASPLVAVSLRDADLVLVATVVAPRESRAARLVRDPARGLRAPPTA